MSDFFPSLFTLECVTVEYIGSDSTHPALDRLSLEIGRGSWTAIVGDNGSGKSTLAKVLAGMIPITEGRLKVTDNRRLYMVLQNPETQILGETILEEMQLSLTKRSFTNSIEQKNYISHILHELGLTLSLNTNVMQLSGGQKQLLNMACCMAAGAEAILFDEAASMLDPASRKRLLEAAVKLHQSGKTILWITHRMEELCYAERVVLMKQGQVAFNGEVQSFFYGPDSDSSSLCEQFGFEPPYVVKIARELQRLGHDLPIRPLFADQLCQAVVTLCPSR
jgi:energy-coupling factor transport system ATP-binding protein